MGNNNTNRQVRRPVFVLNKIQKQRGQSMVEYSIVTIFCVMVLVFKGSDDKMVIVELANALKNFYNAFAFALSYSSTIMPL
jgi:hypothetical protein